MGPEQQAAAATLQAGVPLDVLKDLKDYAPGHDGHSYMVIMFPLDSVSPLAGVAAHQEPQSESGHLQAPAATENLFTRSASPLNTVHERGFTSSLAATAGAAHVHGCSQVTILQVCNSKLRLWCPQTWERLVIGPVARVPGASRLQARAYRQEHTLSTGGIETTSYRALRMGSASMFSWVSPMGKARTVCRLGGKRSRSLSMAVARPAMPAGTRERAHHLRLHSGFGGKLSTGTLQTRGVRGQRTPEGCARAKLS